MFHMLIIYPTWEIMLFKDAIVDLFLTGKKNGILESTVKKMHLHEYKWLRKPGGVRCRVLVCVYMASSCQSF